MNIKQQVAKIQQSAISDPRFKQSEAEPEITDNALAGVNKLFNSILPHFPAWRQSCPTDDDLSRLKLVWTKSLMHHKQKTGKNLNLKAGITACEESETDWLPSVGKFISMCEQSTDLTECAKRALDLFNSAQKQIESVGQMVVSKHGFNLKKMKASDTNKYFVEYYLSYTQDYNIEPLESHLLTDGVQLSQEQQKDADKRSQAAQNSFLSKFSNLVGDKPEQTEVIREKTGITQGSLRVPQKTAIQLEDEKKRQLEMIKGKI
jgi:hypothetical protein